jgi:hypothetical protein
MKRLSGGTMNLLDYLTNLWESAKEWFEKIVFRRLVRQYIDSEIKPMFGDVLPSPTTWDWCWQKFIKMLVEDFRESITSLWGRTLPEDFYERLLLLRGTPVPPTRQVDRVQPTSSIPPNTNTHWDWRDVNGKNYIKPVRNQLMCGSCVGFAVAAAVEARASILEDVPVEPQANDTLPRLSVGQAFFCSDATNSCFEGANLVDALNYCTTTGLVPEADFPYALGTQFASCPATGPGLPNVTRIGTYSRVTDREDMKACLVHYGPLLASMQLPLEFLFYCGGVYQSTKDPAPPSGGDGDEHIVCCIGYDDVKQAWLCKNSLGTHWGDDGYFWIGYGECNVDDHMYVIEDLPQIHKP